MAATGDDSDLFNRIKADLPDYPDEIVATWLVEIAKGYGWPPSQNPSWHYVLRRKPIEAWRDEVVWREDMLPFDLNGFSPMTRMAVQGLFEACFFNRVNAFSNIQGSRQRAERCMDYLVANGTYPHAVIALDGPNGLEIVDGNHRLAAMLLRSYLESAKRLTLNAAPLLQTHRIWIGSVPDSWAD